MTNGQIFLARLSRLCRLRIEHADDFNNAGLQLLGRAIWATVGDCTDYGCGPVAEAIVVAMQHELRASRKAER